MHEALLIDEITLRIADHLFNTDDISSCLALSLCCRSLSGTALDVLWKWQTDFVTLFKVLPPDLWEISNSSGLVSTGRRVLVARSTHWDVNQNLQRFLRSPTPDEWSRFQTYAQRMTDIRAPQGDWVPSEDILHLINLDRSGQTLLPRLKLLHWTTGRAFLPWLHLFLSPNLSVIRIDFNGARATPVNVAVIKALPTTNLRHLALSTLHTNTEVDCGLLDLIFSSRRLETIYVQQETNTGECSPSCDEVDDERERIGLEALTSITTRFKTEPTFLRTFFGRATCPNIREICIKHMGKADWPDVDSLFDPMLRSASPTALHILQYISQYHGMSITSSKVQTLQQFVALRSLCITSLCTTTRCRFFLSDNDVSAIATAMPNLVELYLGGVPCASPVEVSINGLAVLAANCTKLVELQIHFDTTRFITRALDAPNDHTAPQKAASSACQLTQLIVGRMVLSNGMDGYWTVGMALLQIFPNLRNIKYHQQLFNDWGEVMRVIKVQRNIASLVTVRRMNFLGLP